MGENGQKVTKAYDKLLKASDTEGLKRQCVCLPTFLLSWVQCYYEKMLEGVCGGL